MSSLANLTRTEQVREIVKCGKNSEYFIRTYTKIQHSTQGIIPFETYDFQNTCLESFEKHRLNIVLKSRQLGLSTICAAYAVWMMIYQKDKNVLVVATKLSTAINFIKKVRTIVENLPKWLLLPKFEPSKQQITFSNGSSIKAIPTSPDAGRSEALSLLIIDEAAWIRDFDDIWTGLAPTFSTGGRAIILSTPNGVGGQYYNLWSEAICGQNGFNPIKIMWYEHPEHDQAWFDKETRSLGKKQISQEYLCDFIASGDTFLQPEELEAVFKEIRSPIEKAGDKLNIWIWSQPVPGKQYVMSADIARGDAQDFSAFHVIDMSNGEVVAEYIDKIPPEKFADLLYLWGEKYNTALIIPENNTFGYFVCKKLQDLDYKKLYYHNNDNDPFNYIPQDPDENPGFPTTQKTRIQILTKLEELIRNKKLLVYSQRLYDQLQSFIWNGNKPQASKDSHDDLVMCLAIGAWLFAGGSKVAGRDEYAYAILQATSKSSRSASESTRYVPPAAAMILPQVASLNPYAATRPKDGSKSAEYSDFNWLLN